MRMRFRGLTITQAIIGTFLWILAMLVTIVLVSTARMAEAWDANVGFWAWLTTWLAFCIFMVWLLDRD